jgi:hypothetical protein
MDDKNEELEQCSILQWRDKEALTSVVPCRVWQCEKYVSHVLEVLSRVAASNAPLTVRPLPLALMVACET